MKRRFEVAIEQVSQVLYSVWAEDPAEAETIATRRAMDNTKPDRLLSLDVTSCFAEEARVESDLKVHDRDA